MTPPASAPALVPIPKPAPTAPSLSQESKNSQNQS